MTSNVQAILTAAGPIQIVSAMEFIDILFQVNDRSIKETLMNASDAVLLDDEALIDVEETVVIPIIESPVNYGFISEEFTSQTIETNIIAKEYKLVPFQSKEEVLNMFIEMVKSFGIHNRPLSLVEAVETSTYFNIEHFGMPTYAVTVDDFIVCLDIDDILVKTNSFKNIPKVALIHTKPHTCLSVCIEKP